MTNKLEIYMQFIPPLSSITGLFSHKTYSTDNPCTSSASPWQPSPKTPIDSIRSGTTHTSWKNRLQKQRYGSHQSEEKEDMLNLHTQIYKNLSCDKSTETKDLITIGTLGH